MCHHVNESVDGLFGHLKLLPFEAHFCKGMVVQHVHNASIIYQDLLEEEVISDISFND